MNWSKINAALLAFMASPWFYRLSFTCAIACGVALVYHRPSLPLTLTMFFVVLMWAWVEWINHHRGTP